MTMRRGTGSIRVLHVDDEPMVLELTSELLSREDDQITGSSKNERERRPRRARGRFV